MTVTAEKKEGAPEGAPFCLEVEHIYDVQKRSFLERCRAANIGSESEKLE